MNIYYIFHRFPHHSKHSGFDQITRFLPGHNVGVTPLLRLMLSCVPGAKKERLVREAWTKGYREEYLGLEANAIIHLLLTHRKVFYVIYGDNCYHYLVDAPNWGRNIIVGAFHHPPSFFNTIIRKKDQLKKLDGVITLSHQSQYYFQEMVDPRKVYFIPHGVDIDFFSPAHRAEDEFTERKNCLSVGWWLRDIEMLKRVIRLMNDMDSSVYFTIVTFERFFKEFNGLKNVELLCGIPDDRLLRLYQTSSLLLLPLKDSTANNVMLEAMACGLPVVTTDVGGVRDYLNDDVAVFAKSGDADSMAEVVCHLLNNKEKRRSMALAARRHVTQNFNWVHIAEKTRMILKGLYER